MLTFIQLFTVVTTSCVF